MLHCTIIFVAQCLKGCVIQLKFSARNVNIFTFVEGRQECLSETMYPVVLNTYMYLHGTDVAGITRYLDAKYDNDRYCVLISFHHFRGHIVVRSSAAYLAISAFSPPLIVYNHFHPCCQ